MHRRLVTGIRSRVRLLLVAIAAAPYGCGEQVGAPVSDRASEVLGQDWDSADDLDALSVLGYADFASIDPDEASGVVTRDERRSEGGYTLVVSIPDARADLLDASGLAVRTWSNPADGQWSRAVLGPEGRLAVVGKHRRRYAQRASPSEIGRYGSSLLACYSWEGERLWQHDIPAHHDVEWTPSGDVLTIVSSPRPVRHGIEIDDDLLVLFSRDGVEKSSVSLYEAATAGPSKFHSLLARKLSRIGPRAEPYDVLHTNSVHWLPFPELSDADPEHCSSCVLVSIRHLSVVAAVDFEQGRVAWSYASKFQYQHEATWLADGRVLVFDNGFPMRGYSRIVEFDPRTLEETWEYRAPNPTDFFCQSRGVAQALPGGNVLVTDSDRGEVFEVTRSGDVVWRYLNVHTKEQGRGTVRAERYSKDWIESLP